MRISKKCIRKQYIDIRNRLDTNDIIYGSEVIGKSLNQLEYVSKAENIMCYVSFGNEVVTHSLIKNWIYQGKQVCVPCVVNVSKENRYMYAVKITDFKELSVCGNFGILEPPLKKANIVTPDMFDVIIVPGSVFDINKNRMGYGAGYYDKFLKDTKKECHKIGICYDFQVIENIPYDEFDVPLDLIVTEKRIII